jgi:hypothetical protein
VELNVRVNYVYAAQFGFGAHEVGGLSVNVYSLFEVGLTIGAASPLDLPWVGDMLDDVRLGVGYQAGDGLDAVKVTTGFPF